MNLRLGFLGALLVCLVGRADAVPVPPAAEEVVKQIEQELAEFEKKSEAEYRKCRDRTAGELKKVQDKFCKEAKLDEAVAVREVIRSLQAGNTPVLGTETPAAAREVYKQHEAELAEIDKKLEAEFHKRREKITADLKQIQDKFCREAKLDEALAVRDLIRSLQANPGDVLPDPGGINDGGANIGKVFYYEVIGTDTGSAIWGTDVYTTGSHLGMAAVHSGVLKKGQKGIVKVTILPGQESYTGSTRNGVISHPYGNWGVSFKVSRSIGFVGKQGLKAQP